MALKPGETARELLRPVPWLVLSLVVAGSVHWLAALPVSFLFFLAGLRLVHDTWHRSLGLPRWSCDAIMSVLSILMLGSMHAVRITHLVHHRRCLESDDIEGESAAMGAFRSILSGLVLAVRKHARAWRVAGPRDRRWIAAELLLNAGWVALVFGVLEVGALEYHVAAMAAGQALFPFFSVWLVHRGCDGRLARTARGRLQETLFSSMFYHAEHHLFPAVPTRRLHRLAERIDEAIPDVLHRSILTRTPPDDCGASGRGCRVAGPSGGEGCLRPGPGHPLPSTPRGAPMNRRISPTLPAILVVIGAAAANAQGLYWEEKMSGGPAGPGGVEVTIKNHAVPGLFKQSSDIQGGMIVRTKEELIQGVDSRKKTYWELTFSEMEGEMKKMEATMKQALEQMDKQLAGLPPEQRKAIEKQLEGQRALFKKGGKIDVSSTDEKKTIAGYSATKYVVKEDGKDVGAVWASKDVKGFKPIEKDLRDMMKRMTSMNPGSKTRGEAYLKIEGFPLESDVGGMKTTVTKIEERAIPPAEFEVPKDYKKEDSPFSQMLGPGGPGGGPGRKPADKGKGADKGKPD